MNSRRHMTCHSLSSVHPREGRLEARHTPWSRQTHALALTRPITCGCLESDVACSSLAAALLWAARMRPRLLQAKVGGRVSACDDNHIHLPFIPFIASCICICILPTSSSFCWSPASSPCCVNRAVSAHPTTADFTPLLRLTGQHDCAAHAHTRLETRPPQYLQRAYCTPWPTMTSCSSSPTATVPTRTQNLLHSL